MRNWGTKRLNHGQDGTGSQHQGLTTHTQAVGSSLSHYAILPPDGQSGIAAGAHHMAKHGHAQVRGNENSRLSGVNVPTEKMCKIRLES